MHDGRLWRPGFEEGVEEFVEGTRRRRANTHLPRRTHPTPTSPPTPPIATPLNVHVYVRRRRTAAVKDGATCSAAATCHTLVPSIKIHKTGCNADTSTNLFALTICIKVGFYFPTVVCNTLGVL